jgi:lipoprotein NlpI
MKKYLIFFTMVVLLSMAGCQGSENAQEMLQNENKRQQVYNTILEDEEMRNEMMALMREHNMSGGMMGRGGMAGNRGMVGDTTGMSRMNRQQLQARMQQMMALCETDSAACKEMTGIMLENRALMGNMMQRMREGGMQEGCLQQMLRQLNP